MESLEFPRTSEAEFTTEFVSVLKFAASHLKVPELEWTSSDESTLFVASPIDAPEITRGFDITKLGQLPLYIHDNVFNIWSMSRSVLNEDGSLTVNRYLLGAGVPLHTTTSILSGELLNPELVEQEAAKINASYKLQLELGLTKPTFEDYAYLDDGLQKLNELATQALHDEIERRLSLSGEERAKERRQVKIDKFQNMMIGREYAKTEGIQWWLVSEGQFLFAVRSYTNYEAMAILDEYHEEIYGTNVAPLFFIDKNDAEDKRKFDEEFKGREVVRLIPFSREAWPEDMGNMTAEQREALDELLGDSQD